MEEYRFKINVYNKSAISDLRESPMALLAKLYPDRQQIAYKWFNTYEKARIWCDLNGIDLIDSHEYL